MQWDKYKQRYQMAGTCQWCGSTYERVLPITIWVCSKCLKRFILLGAPVHQKKPKKAFTCDWCLGYHNLVRWSYYINPNVCERCLMKMKNKLYARRRKWEERDRLARLKAMMPRN